ncbi:MAG TPA: TIGR01548 family HAD-type hydrolase [Cyanobacteria bacterium UBA8156]|jgi:HAD superfamily phosphatase|nr:TIGR01548 family HAD-type hydrolase [Cyanobacteria bacterium UBA8156]
MNSIPALVLDIDGVLRDVSQSYRRALADTVAHFGGERPTPQAIDALKAEGQWNNDWEASQELLRRQGIAAAFGEIVAYFQGQYRGDTGDDPTRWTGYIAQEPLLANPKFFANLTAAGIPWGFFSGATRASARFVLGRLGVTAPVLVAMEDAPGKPDPTGLLAVADRLGADTVIYAGDTAADMLTVVAARQQRGDRRWIAVGVVPPHVLAGDDPEAYRQTLRQKGADAVVDSVLALTPTWLRSQ